MKIRTGFVSNSSSCSFTCDFCARTESGWDLGLSEAGMVKCINGHTSCENHQKDGAFSAEKTIAEQKEILLKDPDWCMTIKPDMSDREIEKLYDKWAAGDARYSLPAALCSFCTLDEVMNDNLVAYLLKSTDVTREQVLEQIREQFVGYDEFKNFIKS